MASIRRRQLLAAAGAALASPLVRAQRAEKVARLGLLISSPFSNTQKFWTPFFAAMRDRGWREGVNFVLEPKETRGEKQRALELAKELVAHPVDLVLAISTANAMAMKEISDRIPVVTWCGYPVEAGLAASLARPGANVTGVANYADNEVWGKFVELLYEVRPGLRGIGVLWDYAPPRFPDGLIPLPAIEHAAKKMQLESSTWMVRNEGDLNEALSAIERRSIEALIMTNGGGVHHQPSSLKRLSEFLIRRRLPAITDVASTVLTDGGCVLAYSPNVAEMQVRLADFIDRILRGANPGELPFERPSRFDLALNMKTARAMGLAVPRSLLLRADRVVE